MEYLEQTLSRRNMIYIRKAKQYGPIIGSFLGVIPQCGFSVSAANLYATGLISLGTMLAVFLSTSDEMIPVLLSSGIGGILIIKILVVKVFFAVIIGLLGMQMKDKKFVLQIIFITIFAGVLTCCFTFLDNALNIYLFNDKKNK